MQSPVTNSSEAGSAVYLGDTGSSGMRWAVGQSHPPAPCSESVQAETGEASTAILSPFMTTCGCWGWLVAREGEHIPLCFGDGAALPSPLRGPVGCLLPSETSNIFRRISQVALWGKKLEIDQSTSSRVEPLALPCRASQGPLEKGEIRPLPWHRAGGKRGFVGPVVRSWSRFGSRGTAVTLTFHADSDRLLQNSPVLSSGRPRLPDHIPGSAC